MLTLILSPTFTTHLTITGNSFSVLSCLLTFSAMPMKNLRERERERERERDRETER